MRMGEHRGWTIRVAPQRKDETWTAVVEVWPPDLSHQTTGLVVPFTRFADDEAETLDSAMAAARRYIDAAACR